MSNELPYLPFFVGDFLVTVGTWPADRVGAYALALFYQFEHGGLPAGDEAELARILHVTSRSAARRLWEQIQQKHKFHRRDDGLWWNQRLEDVRAEARVKVATATNRGKSGAAARWGKGANGAQAIAGHGNAQALPEQSPDDGNQANIKKDPPKPPAVRGASRNRKRPLSRLESQRIADAKRATEMTEWKRLVAGGMSRAEANRKVGW